MSIYAKIKKEFRKIEKINKDEAIVRYHKNLFLNQLRTKAESIIKREQEKLKVIESMEKALYKN